MEGKSFHLLHRYVAFCRSGLNIIWITFGFSLLYNVAGIYFAVQGKLSPLTAAILMPSSSLSILLITFGASSFAAKWKKLQINNSSKDHLAN